MVISTYRTVGTGAVAVMIVLNLAMRWVDLDTPATFMVTVSATALAFGVAWYCLGRYRAALRTRIRGVNAGAATLRVETAEMRRRLADLKAYQVLVSVPETDEQRARMRQLIDALNHQRAIVEARTKDTNAATADLRTAAGLKPLR